MLAKYVYDAWGNHKVYDGNNIPVTTHSHIGYINPIRYKGYYYDVETKLYYCQARYYSPELCRFIQPADVSTLNPQSINGLNLYSYAISNPIGFAYSSCSVGGGVPGGVVSWLALGIGTFIHNFGSGNYGFEWPNLDFLGTGFGYIENTFSMIAGVVDGIRNIRHLDKLAGLDKASNWLMGIGIFINVGLSIYNNLLILI